MSDIYFSTRLNSFALGEGRKHPEKAIDTIALIEIAATVKGLNALEINYPEHFTSRGVAEIATALDKANLVIKGVQLRWPAPKFADGGFANPDKSIRREAIDMVAEAIKVAKELKTDHVLLWPAHDGYEYPLQMNYVDAWLWFKEALQELADIDPSIRISIEYKPAEPRGRTLLNTTGAVMKMIADVNRPNVGVTLDFGHLLMAHENPAQSAAMCLADNKLFALQLNDSHGMADDGLLVGSIHAPETLELTYYLAKYGYTGTYYFDTDPIRENPVRECEMNIERMRYFIERGRALAKSHPDLAHGDALLSSEVIWNTLKN
jgi:xylose isomerase